jgi:DNA-binding CsgD family transcriptional regulator
VKSFSVADLKLVQRATLELYSHRDTASFSRAVPGIFLRVIPADYFALRDARIDHAKRSFRVLNVWESRPLHVGETLEAVERNMLDHPFTQHALKHGPTGALRLSDFVTLPRLRTLRLYREVLAPLEMGWVMAIGSFGGPGVATLSITRRETEPDFTERDRFVLETLRPHFDQARANLERETLVRASRLRSLAACGLTPRETEIALWLAQGKSNPEIAIILGAPPRTVEKHVERILNKMGVENRASAAIAVTDIVRA